MLNELYQLHEALPSDLNLYEWHKQMKELPRISKLKPCFKILIGDEGVEDIFPMSDLPAAVRKWETSNGISFPAFNIRPLFHCSTNVEKRRQEIGQQKKVIQKGLSSQKLLDSLSDCAKEEDVILSKKLGKDIEEGKLAYEKLIEIVFDLSEKESIRTDYHDRLTKCLYEKAKEIKGWDDHNPEAPKALAVLVCRVLNNFEEIDSFRHQLELIVREKIKSKEHFFYFLPFFVSVNEKQPGNDIALLLEVVEQSSVFDYPVQHEKTSKWINEYLLFENVKRLRKVTTAEKFQDAYGEQAIGWTEKLPSVRLPVLGDITLRAMNHESPCQHRYGRIDAKSFVIGEKSRSNFTTALKWLGDDSRRGRTWQSISRSVDVPELLFAYPTSAPDSEANISAMFGGDEANITLDETTFEHQAKQVVDALKAVDNNLSSVDIQIFGLRKMDKARTQVTCSEHLTAAILGGCASNWQKGCRNLPPLKIGHFPKGEKKSSWETPHIPLPMQVIWCLNSVWTHLGKRCNRSKAFSGRDGVALLIGENVRVHSLAKHMLSQFIQRFQPLLLEIGNQQHRGLVFSSKGAKKFVAQARIAPSIAALLLYKTETKKENYMQTPAFLVGRLFGLSDQIHHLYCKHVRNKQEPPQLLGNTLMAAALESPVKAMGLFAQRIIPYQAWARTFSSKDETNQRRVRGTLKAIGLVSDELKDCELSVRMQDADKAQMILGYLARSK